MTILYEDEYIICDDDALTILYYYFPFGDKCIPYKKINQVSTQEMTWWTGKIRIWDGSLSYWLNLDHKRPWKDKLIIIDEGDLTKPVITPDNPEQVYQILLSKIQ